VRVRGSGTVPLLGLRLGFGFVIPPRLRDCQRHGSSEDSPRLRGLLRSVSGSGSSEGVRFGRPEMMDGGSTAVAMTAEGSTGRGGVRIGVLHEIYVSAYREALLP